MFLCSPLAFPCLAFPHLEDDAIRRDLACGFADDGTYIRGLKPDGQMGNPVFEADALRCTGASGRLGSLALAFTLAALVVTIAEVLTGREA